MAVESFTTNLTNEWQEVLSGVGTVQVQTPKRILIKVDTVMPTTNDGAFYKTMYDEVSNTDSAYNIYAKGNAIYVGTTATWKVI